MNDLMSGGVHRLWKAFAVALAGVREGERVLDVAAGSGDLAFDFAKRAGASGEVWLTDINRPMLERGRDRLLDRGRPVPAVQCDAEGLPFPPNYFDCVSVAFGLRNMTRKDAALAEMRRVLRPGGRLLVLEFSRVWRPQSRGPAPSHSGPEASDSACAAAATGDGAATVRGGALVCASRRTRRGPWLGLALRAGRLRRRNRRVSRGFARRCRSVRLDASPVEAAPAASADALRRRRQRNRGCAAALAASRGRGCAAELSQPVRFQHSGGLRRRGFLE